MWHFALLFFLGFFAGTLVEYFYHWFMHKKPLEFHFQHHKEFFHLPPNVVADNARCLVSDSKLAVKILLGFALFMPWFVWLPPLVVFTGMFIQLMIVYHSCHALFHNDAWLPGAIRESKFYKWWRGCHMAHHFHAPRGNFSVTFPVLDMLFGTYVRPRPSYPKLPPKRQPREDKII